MKKPSEFLADHDSHGVYDAEAVALAYAADVGEPAPWRGRTPAEVMAAMRERGVGGYLRKDATGNLVSGWEMAEAVATAKGVHGWEMYQGRGRRFHSCVEALQKAGY